MAIAQPALVVAEMSQDMTWTVALDPEEDVTGWTVTTTVRAYNGGSALITKTIGSGITVSSMGTGVFVTSFDAADLTLSTFGPGAYVIQMHRTNSGFVYPITDPSCLLIRPADSTAYPTLTNLGEFAAHALLGITLTDALAKQYIQLLFAAEDWVKRYCGRDFHYRTLQTEYYDGTGTQNLLLERFPVYPNTVTIYEDQGGYGGVPTDAFASTTLLERGVDYHIPITPTWSDGLNHSGIIKRLGRVWPFQVRRPPGRLTHGVVDPLPGCIKVVYTAGYALIPHSLKRAVWDLTTIMAEQSSAGRLMQSESGEGYSYSQGSPDDSAPWSVVAALAPFRRVTVW